MYVAHQTLSIPILLFPGNFRCFGQRLGTDQDTRDTPLVEWEFYIWAPPSMLRKPWRTQDMLLYLVNFPMHGQNTHWFWRIHKFNWFIVIRNHYTSTITWRPSATRDSGGQDATKISILVLAWSSGSAPAANMKTCAGCQKSSAFISNHQQFWKHLRWTTHNAPFQESPPGGWWAIFRNFRSSLHQRDGTKRRTTIVSHEKLFFFWVFLKIWGKKNVPQKSWIFHVFPMKHDPLRFISTDPCPGSHRRWSHSLTCKPWCYHSPDIIRT